MHRVFENAVKSVAKAPVLVLLISDAQLGWCEQFAQEGYTVVQVAYPTSSLADFAASLDAAGQHVLADRSSWAIVTYGLLKDDKHTISRLLEVAGTSALKALVHYAPLTEDVSSLLVKGSGDKFTQTLVHLASSQDEVHASLQARMTADLLLQLRTPADRFPLAVYTYPLVPSSPPFPFIAGAPTSVIAGEVAHVDPYIRSATSLAYSRTLDLLRRELGPHFELEKLWEKHTYYEFVERDAPKTMATMVQTPYVNHVSTLIGGVGYKELARFYKYHFTSETVTPPDTELITVSRTVGADRIIDEMIFKCTHTTEIDYFLPGIKPTGKKLELALVGVVAFRGDKLTFEHIYWDQASALVQLGLLDPTSLPIAGVEVAQKVLDPFGVPSNALLTRWSESEGLSVD